MDKTNIKEILKKSSNISIDFDGTLLPLFHQCTCINPNKIPFRKFYNSFERIWVKLIQDSMHSFPHTQDTLELLSNKHNLIVITSRQKHLTDLTIDYLQKHKLDSYFSNVIHNDRALIPWEQKQKEIKSQHINLHLEDDPFVLSKLSNTLTDTYFIYFNHNDRYTPYNHKNTFEVSSWSELFKLLKA